MPQPLPIDEHVGAIVAALSEHGALVVVAPPGAGKTTRVPPALVGDGPVVLLQPRRVAARSLARRIATERGWTVGREVGWQVRFERRFGPDTRLLVATEGVLTARLQADPLLSRWRTVVLDEFHERSVHADLALAFVRQARRARGDLRLLVMSATLDAEPIAAFLGGCPVIELPGRTYPLEIEHAAGLDPAGAALRAVEHDATGHVLCFLPGAAEIERVAREVGPRLPPGVRVLPLHGSLPAEAQDAALAPSAARKLILATNIAETSLTVEGVTQVVDSGLHKVLRADPASGLDRLETERIPRDSAEQRAGRAGRTGPGRVLRLWDPRLILRERREPEIERVDLAAPFLEVLAWGDDPTSFGWFEPPPAGPARTACELLERLGATRAGRITELGRALRRLPLHPRLGRVLLAAGGDAVAAAASAILAEGWTSGTPPVATACDLWPAIDGLGAAPRRVREAARQLERLAGRLGTASRPGEAAPGGADERLRRALFAGYPDRVAQRRESGSRRLRLASGHGAVLLEDSGVREGEFLVALDLRAGARGPGSEARVRLASRVERAWLAATASETVHEIDPQSGVVRAVARELHGALVLSETPATADPERAAEMLRDAMLERGLGERAAADLRRARFAGLEVDLPERLLSACRGRQGWFEFDLPAALDHEARRTLDRLAPLTLAVPSGRRVRLDYREDGTVAAAVKLQELFGLAESPRVGRNAVPVTFSLLAPSGRPVQTTSDLRSFWSTTYAQVCRELRGRYPKHPWPDDPWAAAPTARPKRRG